MSPGTPTPRRVSSPAATGGAGNLFEQHVSAYWLAHLLVQAFPPILRDCTVTGVHFQTERLGYSNDDFLVTAEREPGASRRLLGQVKRSFVVSAADEDCRKTIRDCWTDFGGGEFTPASDCFAIVTLRGTNNLLEYFSGLLECARAATDADDFEHRLATPGFVHAKVCEYCTAIRAILNEVAGRPVAVAEVWPFLKTLHVLSLDLTTSTAQVEGHVKTLLARATDEPDSRRAAEVTWNELLREAGDGLAQGKSYSRDSFPDTIRRRHRPVRTDERDAIAVLDPLRQEIRNLSASIVSQLLPHITTTDANRPFTRQQEVVGRRQAAVWEDRARRSLDVQGQRLWEDIRREVRSLNNTRAVNAGRDLVAWLEGDGVHASHAIRGRACVLLADLAVIGSAMRSLEERVDTSDARRWYARALDEFGTSPSAEDAARLVYLEARLTWLEGRPADALAALDGVEDASCRSLALSVLLAEGRVEEAVAVARAVPPDDRWCDRLTIAFARAGLPDEADAVVIWAQGRPDPVVSQRCLLARGQGTMQRQFGTRDGRSLLLGPLSADDTAALRDLLHALQPLVAPVAARGRPAGGVESEAVELAFTVGRLLGATDQWRAVGALLRQATPVSTEYARAVCRGDLEDPGTLPARLRTDYPESLLAGHLAAVIEARGDAPFDDIVRRVEDLIPLAATPEQRESLAELLGERAIREEGVAALERARELADRLLPPDHSFLRMVRYELLRRGGREREADDLLDAARDESDPLWQQMAAAREHRRGHTGAALGHLLAAARLLCRAETCWLAFDLARRQDDDRAMGEMAELLARITPDDVRVHRNLAVLAFNAGRFREAAAALERVERLSPETAENGVLLARALALSGRDEEAARVLSGVCAAHPTALPAFQLRAAVLDALGRAAAAFEGLHAARERFWGDLGFVGLYHSLAYKANREDEAHLAFLRIMELQNGDADGPVLRGGTLDDLREFMRTQRERHEHLNRLMIGGRLPWPLVGRALHRESYIDWAMRTQEMLVPDAPVARAEYTVYATNGCAVGVRADGFRELIPVASCPPGQPVVADLSALVTLHRLGFLDRALAHFGRVVLPAGYVARFLEDHRSLQPHQPSELEARRAILAAVDQGRMRPAEPRESPSLSTLDEHHLEDEHPDFHLMDAVRWLQVTGRLTDPEYARAAPVCRHPPVPDPTRFRAAAPRGVLVSVTTLVTAHKIGLLDRLLVSVKVRVEQGEVEGLRRDLLGVGHRAEVMGWSRELHTLLTGDTRVETAEPARRQREGEGRHEPDPVLDAVLLAEQQQLPLLTDDRCMQGMILNARQGRPGTAFGTDALLRGLHAAGALTPDEHATAWLQLARWRYRFLTATPEVLLTLAARHPAHPPGEPLREVCRYLHECCLDPALFCGMEPTEPPVSVGWWYFQHWVQVIGRFLMRAWHEPRFDDRAVTALTHWCVGEFLPPAPRNLEYAGHTVAAQAAPRVALISALSDQAVFQDLERSSAALSAMEAAFGLAPDEYDSLMTTMVEADLAAPCVSGERDAVDAVRRLTAVAAFHRRDGLGLRTASTLSELGLMPRPERQTDELDCEAISEPSHPRRLSLPQGPWAALRPQGAGGANDARNVPELIFHRSGAVRRAAFAHLRRGGDGPAPWLTPVTLETLAAATPDIAADAPATFRAAARLADTALSRDFLLPMARLRQAHALHWAEEREAALRALIEPRPGVLGSVPPGWYGLPGEEWEGFLRGVPAESCLAAALDRYYDRYGHLPLASSHGMEAVVGAWAAAHGPEGLWEALRSWADDPACPLRKYHLSRVFLAHPSLVPDERLVEAWATTAAVVGYDIGETGDTPQCQGWDLLHALSRHYHHLLEVEAATPDATGLAALAWWAAERVTREVVRAVADGRDAAGVAGILRGTVRRNARPLAMRSGIAAMFGRPLRGPSALAYATGNLHSLWRPALLETRPAAEIRVPAAHREPFFATFVMAIGTGFPAREASAPRSPLAIDVPFPDMVARWVDAMADDAEATGEPDAVEPPGGGPPAPAGSGPEGIDETAAGTADAVTPPPGIEARLRAMLDREEDERFLLLQQFRAAVHLGRIDLGAMGWLLEDRGWWDRAFDALPLGQLEDLCSLLIELLRRCANEEWHLNLPHLFRQQAAREGVEPDRLFVLAGAVLQACVVTASYSALHLLLPMVSPELEQTLGHWRTRITELRRVLPPPVQARLRTLLAFLPPEPLELGPEPAGDVPGAA